MVGAILIAVAIALPAGLVVTLVSYWAAWLMTEGASEWRIRRAARKIEGEQ